jgi:hypothetical protein
LLAAGLDDDDPDLLIMMLDVPEAPERCMAAFGQAGGRQGWQQQQQHHSGRQQWPGLCSPAAGFKTEQSAPYHYHHCQQQQQQQQVLRQGSGSQGCSNGDHLQGVQPSCSQQLLQWGSLEPWGAPDEEAGWLFSS